MKSRPNQTCPYCQNPMTLDEVDDRFFCDECGAVDEEPEEYDNGPTGHGPDLCWSDADPGL